MFRAECFSRTQGMSAIINESQKRNVKNQNTSHIPQRKMGKKTLQDVKCEHLQARPELAWPNMEECQRGVIKKKKKNANRQTHKQNNQFLIIFFAIFMWIAIFDQSWP